MCDEVKGVPAIETLFAARIVALLRGCHCGKQGVKKWATKQCQQQPTGFLRVGHKFVLFLFLQIRPSCGRRMAVSLWRMALCHLAAAGHCQADLFADQNPAVAVPNSPGGRG